MKWAIKPLVIFFPHSKKLKINAISIWRNSFTETFPLIHVCCLFLCSLTSSVQHDSEFLIVFFLLPLFSFGFKFRCLTQSCTETMTAWSSQVPRGHLIFASWYVSLAHSSYVKKVLIFCCIRVRMDIPQSYEGLLVIPNFIKKKERWEGRY